MRSLDVHCTAINPSAMSFAITVATTHYFVDTEMDRELYNDLKSKNVGDGKQVSEGSKLLFDVVSAMYGDLPWKKSVPNVSNYGIVSTY